MRALLYANTDGIANLYHGSGVQTRVLLDIWRETARKLSSAGCDDWRLHVAVHDWETPSTDYRVDSAVLHDSLAKAREGDVRIHRLEHTPHTKLWSYPRWAELSSSVTALLSRLAEEYEQVLFVGVDVPYSLVREHCENSLPPHKLEKITFALSFHTSALVAGQTWLPGREALERDYVRRANEDASTFITTLTPFFDRKIELDYGARDEAWMRLGHGIAPRSANLTPYPREKAVEIAGSFGIPRGVPIVVHFGRDHPMKRIPFAIEAVARVGRPLHFVLIASTPANAEGIADAPHADQLKQELDSYTYLTHFERELPKALAQLPETVAFLLSAAGEPMGQIPQEVACWTDSAAPVVVAPEDGGYGDQISDAETGFTFDVHSVASCTRAIERAMKATLNERKAISVKMKNLVHENFDASTKLCRLLMSVESGEHGMPRRQAGAEAK